MAPKERQVSLREPCACCYCTKCHLGDERSGQGRPRCDRGGPRGTEGDRGGPRGEPRGTQVNHGGRTRTDGDQDRTRQDKTAQRGHRTYMRMHLHTKLATHCLMLGACFVHTAAVPKSECPFRKILCRADLLRRCVLRQFAMHDANLLDCAIPFG